MIIECMHVFSHTLTPCGYVHTHGAWVVLNGAHHNDLASPLCVCVCFKSLVWERQATDRCVAVWLQIA